MTFLGEAAGRAIGEGVKRRNHRGTRGNTKATTNEQTMKATTKKQTTKDTRVARRFYLTILRDSLVSFVVKLWTFLNYPTATVLRYRCRSPSPRTAPGIQRLPDKCVL